MSAQRGSLVLEDAEILDHRSWPGEQFTLRLHAPGCASRARPGQFVHVTCDPSLPMRRPFSVMRAAPAGGWIELLYKRVGRGTRMLSGRRVGERISVLGPVGHGFSPNPERPRVLLLGGGVGIPPMIFLADALRRGGPWRPLVLMGSEVPFPFNARPSGIMVEGMPEGVIGAMPLLEDWGVPSRLASLQGYPGCHEGYITDLAERWLQGQDSTNGIGLFACGPPPMLSAVAALARRHGLPCQLSLEEYMACAVGGCAGCVVEVSTPSGPAMRRVCVDGPVFEAGEVFPG